MVKTKKHWWKIKDELNKWRHIWLLHIKVIKNFKILTIQALMWVWTNWNSHTLLQVCKMKQPCWRTKTVWQFLTKWNIYLPHDLALPLLNIYPRVVKTYVYTKTFIQMFSSLSRNQSLSRGPPTSSRLLFTFLWPKLCHLTTTVSLGYIGALVKDRHYLKSTNHDYFQRLE